MCLHACKTHLYLMLVMPSSLVARLDCNLYPLQLMPLSLFKKETPHVMLFLFSLDAQQTCRRSCNEICHWHLCTAQPALQCKASTAMLNMQSHMLSIDDCIMQVEGQLQELVCVVANSEGCRYWHECYVTTRSLL